MNVRSMEYLLAIEKTGSLSAAGRLLKVSQPTLTVFVQGLEQQLGAALFRREGRCLVPTAQGRVLLNAAREIVAVKEQTYQTIHRLTHHQSSRIVIGATPLRGSLMVAQVFPAFNRRFPDVELVIREGYTRDIKDWVQRGQVDCALSSYISGEEGFEIIATMKEEIVAAVPGFHPMAAMARERGDALPCVDIRCFADSPFVLMAEGNTARVVYDRIMEKEGLRPTEVFETNNLLVLCRMVGQGMGVALIPASSMQKNREDTVYFSIYPRYYMHLGMLLPPGRNELSEAERYLAYLVIRSDMENPAYRRSLNVRAQQILNEFEGEDTL